MWPTGQVKHGGHCKAIRFYSAQDGNLWKGFKRWSVMWSDLMFKGSSGYWVKTRFCGGRMETGGIRFLQ